MEEIVRLAGAACGAERIFLVQATGRDAEQVRVVTAESARGDGRAQPSRWAMRRAIEHRRPTILLDLGGEDAAAPASSSASDAPSVRSLALRSIVAAPVPLPRHDRLALLLDSRDGFRLPGAELQAAVGAFAALVAAAWRLGAGRPPGETDEFLLGERDSRVSPAQRSMVDWVRRIAPAGLPVLVEGESGSGKERVARAIHRLGPRRTGPFVAVNCAAVAESLLEAELFGSERGAYTGSDRDRPGLFRHADGGTLFLDEVGDMPRAMQAKLLRVLDTGRVRPVGGVVETAVDVRLVAATHRDLRRRVADGRFRADLYHRLAVVQVRVPPLRRRLEDLERLVSDLSPRIRRETGCVAIRLAADARDALREHDWPGNVRELHAVLARAALRSNGAVIRARDLDLAGGVERAACEEVVTLERRMIEAALRDAAGGIAGAAERIGWTRQKLYRRMEALGVKIGNGIAPDE